MAQLVTLGDLVKYVLQYRKGMAFKDYPELLIAHGIKCASDSNTMLYSCRDDGSLCGIVVATENKDAKTIMVDDILTTERWVLPLFVKTFVTRFPGYTLLEIRHGQVKQINTDKLCRRILKGL